MTIIILRPFMRAVPVELEDAAAIDGCSKFGFFWRILLPLSRPALMTVAVLAVVTSWNCLPAAAARAQRPERLDAAARRRRRTRASTLRTQRAILAYTALSMVPALLFFIVAERRIVGGLSGAVKG